MGTEHKFGRRVLGYWRGEAILEHDHIHDYQQCPECGTWTGADTWPDEHPYQDEHPDEFRAYLWRGRCPVCGCEETGLPAGHFEEEEE